MIQKELMNVEQKQLQLYEDKRVLDLPEDDDIADQQMLISNNPYFKQKKSKAKTI